ncbi:MAG: 4Fe-4S binding protein [Endomicrobiales bacterium]
MKRDIIKIDEEKCNGCGMCIPNCPEGALQIIEGKIRLISDLFCDGLGACIGHCPQGAISIEQRDSQPYDERQVMANIVKAGPAVTAAHLKHLKDHGQTEFLNQALTYLRQNNIAVPPESTSEEKAPCGCPGSAMKDLRASRPAKGETCGPVLSELAQWPIQLHLINPQAPYFKNAELVIAADCVPFAFGDFHQRFLKGKKLIIFCPKLDDSAEVYISKLTELFKVNNIKSVTLVHMEVPCCFGVEKYVTEAISQSGKNVILKEYTISLTGEIV